MRMGADSIASCVGTRFLLPQKKRQNFRSMPTHTAASGSRFWQETFCPDCHIRNGTIACSVDAIRLSIELGGRSEAEADVVVPILRRVVVAVRDAAIHRVVVPGAAAIHAVRAL